MKKYQIIYRLNVCLVDFFVVLFNKIYNYQKGFIYLHKNISISLCYYPNINQFLSISLWLFQIF